MLTETKLKMITSTFSVVCGVICIYRAFLQVCCHFFVYLLVFFFCKELRETCEKPEGTSCLECV